ncbi:TPA: hypothetical protein ACNOH7_002310 [Vibrio fluvialis]
MAINLKLPSQQGGGGNNSVRVTSSQNQDHAGHLSQYLGTGNNAQNSVVWLTIKWCFISGAVLSTVLILYLWYFTPSCKDNCSVSFPIDNLKTIWSIFVPIITLALGYMFGKGSR